MATFVASFSFALINSSLSPRFDLLSAYLLVVSMQEGCDQVICHLCAYQSKLRCQLLQHLGMTRRYFSSLLPLLKRTHRNSKKLGECRLGQPRCRSCNSDLRFFRRNNFIFLYC